MLLHKYHFPPEVASRVASDLGRPNSPEKADSVLSFLKEIGCSTTQLQKIVIDRPRVLLQGVEGIKVKIKVFQDLGLSPEDIARLVSSNQVILILGAKSKIIPSLSVLKGLLGSDYNVARLIRKCAWFLCVDLNKTLVPNVELLKNFGIPVQHIICFLFSFPSDTLTMFKRIPTVFYVSMKKIDKLKQLLLATGKFSISSIIDSPASLGCSIENRLEPRLRILGILESKNLIKWPSLGMISALTDNKFFEKFVKPYPNEVGKLFVTKSCIRDKK
ncbi:hypothetical protein ACS0TY_004548 [Phlomoides rotata]